MYMSIRRLKIEYHNNELPGMQDNGKLSEPRKKITDAYDQLCRFLCKASKSQLKKKGYKNVFGQMLPEATSRVFIDALMILILEPFNMRPKHEEGYEAKQIPYSKLDYVIYNQNDEILGCIEAKATNKIVQKSIVQCMLQLLVLQAQPKAKDSLFGIVTDAYCFVFIQLDRERGFIFRGCPVYKADTKNDLKDIAGKIYGLLRLNNIEEPGKGEGERTSAKTKRSKVRAEANPVPKKGTNGKTAPTPKKPDSKK